MVVVSSVAVLPSGFMDGDGPVYVVTVLVTLLNFFEISLKFFNFFSIYIIMYIYYICKFLLILLKFIWICCILKL